MAAKKSIFLQRQRGAATLMMAAFLVLLLSLLIVFAANFNILQEKTSNNLYRSNQAFAAAEAGFDYAFAYLSTNGAAIVATANSGMINYTTNLSNITLANSSRFSAAISNVTANNYRLLRITSIGTASDGTTATITQLIQFGSMLVSAVNAPLITLGDITLSGSSLVKNTETPLTIQAGGNVSFSGSSATQTSSGTGSSSSSTGTDVQKNLTTLSNMNQSDLFSYFFGSTSAAVKSQMDLVYTNGGSGFNYSSTLNGVKGKSIWLDQVGGTATINGNTTIGSPTQPVLLVVNGNVNFSGNVTIYGYVFVFGTNTIDSITGSVDIYGAITTAGDLRVSGNTSLNYDSGVLQNLSNIPSMGYYAKVPGSWRDF